MKEIKKTLLKNVVVRWNSIYIMIKSYNKLSQEELTKLINGVNHNERATVKLTTTQNILIKELENVLYNLFYVSQLFQRSKVSSSSVVP